MNSVPLWLRRFTVDFIETAVPSLLVFNWLVPHDALAPAIVTALAAAALSAARRNLNLFYDWLHGIAEIPPEEK